jgi:flagellar biosynthesis/type III secretory pathway chaperone
MSKPSKKVGVKEQSLAVPKAYAVMKRCDQCETPQDRVKPYDAMMGIGSINMSPDQVQSVYFEEKAALAEASKLHKMHGEDMKMLEEKKQTVINKLSEKIDILEAERTKHFKSKNYDQEAQVASKIQELKDKLKRVEKATKINKKLEEDSTVGEESKESFKAELEKVIKDLGIDAKIESESAKKAVLSPKDGEKLYDNDVDELKKKYKVYPHAPEPENEETRYRYTIEAK